MTITLTREEAQQVLDALEEAQSYTSCETWSPSMTDELRKQEKTLRARLSAPEPDEDFFKKANIKLNPVDFYVVEDGEDDWTVWTYPIHKGYLMKCCDCGLVHEVEFRVLKNIKKKKDGSKDGVLMDDDKYQVGLRMRRQDD